MRHIAESLDLDFQIADLLALPIKDVSANCVPSYDIRKSDRHHLRRLVVVTANLINSESDRFILARVLALDHEHRDAVDEKHYVLACAVTAIVDVKLFRHFIDVAPLLARAIQVAIVNHCQVELPVFLSAEKFPLIAKMIQEVAIPGNAGIEPLKLAHQRAFSFLVFRIERTHLRVEKIAEEERRGPRAIFRRHDVRIEPAPSLGFNSRYKFPANVLRVLQDAGLDSLMFAGCGHDYRSADSLVRVL